MGQILIAVDSSDWPVPLGTRWQTLHFEDHPAHSTPFPLPKYPVSDLFLGSGMARVRALKELTLQSEEEGIREIPNTSRWHENRADATHRSNTKQRKILCQVNSRQTVYRCHLSTDTGFSGNVGLGVDLGPGCQWDRSSGFNTPLSMYKVRLITTAST